MKLAKKPIAAHMPEPISTSEMPTRTGGLLPSPVTLMMPLDACTSGS